MDEEARQKLLDEIEQVRTEQDVLPHDLEIAREVLESL